MKHFIVSILGVALLATASKSQGLDFGFLWNLGLLPLEQPCARNGVQLDALLPGLPHFDDPWFLLMGTCMTYGGSVSCQNEIVNENGLLQGTCDYNQGNDLNLNSETYEVYGLVGAICTAEHTSFIPEKKCGDNAHCLPLQAGVGRAVGTCQCVQGYMADTNRECVRGTGETGTPRTTTTTEAPDAGELQLPIELLLNMRFTSYDQTCESAALLNRTYCNIYGGTVACLNKKCQCNMEEDSMYDEELQTCVGLAGSYCLARKNLMGWKACTSGAECYVEQGTTVDEYSFGTCECMYGYRLEEDRTCSRDSSISNPSTRRPGGFPTPSTEAPVITEPPPRMGASAIGSQKLVVIFMTFLCISLVSFYR